MPTERTADMKSAERQALLEDLLLKVSSLKRTSERLDCMDGWGYNCSKLVRCPACAINELVTEITGL